MWRLHFLSGLSDLLALLWKMSLKSCRSEMMSWVKLWDVRMTPGGRLQVWHCSHQLRRESVTSDLPNQRSHLLAVLGGRAEDGQFRPAGLGFGRLTGVEEGLDEGLQVLSSLETRRSETLACLDELTGPNGGGTYLTSFISFPGTDLKIFPVEQQRRDQSQPSDHERPGDRSSSGRL